MSFFQSILHFFAETIQTIIITAVVFLLLYVFIIQPHEVSGSSMFPTFKNKEYVLSYLLDARFNNIKRGDVIVFRSPVDEEKLFIKRVIAVSGDRIKVENGKVQLNGVLLDETEYLDPSVTTFGGSYLQEGIEDVVPEGEFFVMGDNRPYSSDSREWGFLENNRIIGRSLVRVWPLTDIKWVENPYNSN